MDQLIERIDTIATDSRKLKSPVLCNDMLHLCNNAHDLLVELSRELVECRRKSKLSPRSKDILDKIDESIAHAEKMLTYAKLVDK